MPTPFWTRAIVLLAAGFWLLLAFVLHVPVDKTWLKALGGIASAVVLVLLAFDYLLWRWLPATITRRPVLHGTWKATLEYRWPESEPPKTKDAYVVIRQTYSTVSVEMLFDISDSHSTSAAIVERNGRRFLSFSYWSASRTTEREANPPHRGGAELGISLKPCRRLDGDYWTERKTVGRITTAGWSRHLFDDFESAHGASYTDQPRRFRASNKGRSSVVRVLD
jgi:hypothetical protein